MDELKLAEKWGLVKETDKNPSFLFLEECPSVNPLRSIFARQNGNGPAKPPLWMMRQAGRYLPEYRALRQQAKSFLDFCYTPAMAIEATLQPIRRFGFDAAIIFSDILVIPDALGQPVRFAEGEGPRLDGIETPEGLSRLSSVLDQDRLRPVYEAITGTRRDLPQEVALIGFCGAPWTLATYMIAGRGTPDQAPARLFAYRHPEAFEGLIALLVEACADHLVAQIKAGAEIVQIFDSWAGVLPTTEFDRWGIRPVNAIVAKVRKQYPTIPIIGFPRAIAGGYARFVTATGVDAIGLDTSADIHAARAELPRSIVSQGNLDPLALLAGGDALDRAIDNILAATSGYPHIFNLGHGILPPTPIAHVERLIEKVRA